MWLEFWGLGGHLSLHAAFPWGFPDPEGLPVVRSLTGKFWGPGIWLVDGNGCESCFCGIIYVKLRELICKIQVTACYEKSLEQKDLWRPFRLAHPSCPVNSGSILS